MALCRKRFQPFCHQSQSYLTDSKFYGPVRAASDCDCTELCMPNLLSPDGEPRIRSAQCQVELLDINLSKVSGLIPLLQFHNKTVTKLCIKTSKLFFAGILPILCKFVVEPHFFMLFCSYASSQNQHPIRSLNWRHMYQNTLGTLISTLTTGVHQ